VSEWREEVRLGDIVDIGSSKRVFYNERPLQCVASLADKYE